MTTGENRNIRRDSSPSVTLSTTIQFQSKYVSRNGMRLTEIRIQLQLYNAYRCELR
jgi:hypothetical protein